MADEKPRRQTWRERGTRRPPELDDPKYDTARLRVRPIGDGSLFWWRKEDRVIEVPIPREWRRTRDQEPESSIPSSDPLESSEQLRAESTMADEKPRRQTWRERGTRRPPELDGPEHDTVTLRLEPIGGGSLFWRRKKDRVIEVPVPPEWRQRRDPER